MANIVLKDKDGANIVYKNVDYVSFQTLEGGTVRFNERAADIISVTELPTEDINDNAIYRLTTKDENGGTTVEFYAHENSGDWIEVAEGAKMSDLVVTENGEYTPVEAEDGFAKVTVNIDTFTDVEEFPTENIDQEAIYRVVRQDEETGATYTTYGIFDADDTKTVLEYNAEEGWVECGAGGGDIRPIEITANGTYDAAVGIPGGVGDLEPGAWYTYKHEIPREDIETLYSFANENGELHKWGSEALGDIVTKIINVDNEYMLMTNNIQGAGQFYCTAEIVYNEKTYPAGWSIVGAGELMGVDTSIPLSISNPLPVVMRMPEVIDNTTILGADGMLDFFKTNLLAKKVNREVTYALANDGTDIAGTINGNEVIPINFGLTLEQFKEPPVITLPPEVVEQLPAPALGYMLETAYQFMLFHSDMMGETYEDDGIYMMLNGMCHIKNLASVSPDIEIEGDFQEGVWYMPTDLSIPVGFYTYYPVEEGIPPCDGYNPVVVNIPMVELYATKNGVYENPTTNLPIDADSLENGAALQFNENITFSKKVLEQFKEYCWTDSWNGVDYAYYNIYEHYDAYERLCINTYTDGTFDVCVDTIDGFYVYIPEEQIALYGQDIMSSGITTAGWHLYDSETETNTACEAPVLTISDIGRLHRTTFDLVSAALFGSPAQAAGYSKVTVNVPEKLIAPINITENGVYRANAPITFREATVKDCKTAGTALYVKEHIELKEETIANILEYGHPGHDYIKDVDCICASFEYISEGGDARLAMYEDSHYELQMYYWNDTFIYSSLTREWTHQNRNMESPVTVSYEDVPVIWVSGYVNSDQFGYGFAPECFNVYGTVDGWNEVNVNVTNGVLNVAALPTENVDTSKVYRISEEKLAGARYYLKYSAGPAMTIEEAWYGEDRASSCYHVVDEFPATVEEYDEVTSHGTLTGCNAGMRMAVLRSTGETMMYEPAFTDPVQPLLDTVQGCFGDYPFHGIVESVNDMTEPGFYTLFIKEQVVKGYGIADDSLPIMVYKNGAWVRFVEEVVTPEPEEPTDPEATT